MHQFVSRLARSHFLRNILVLMTGSITAQLINVAFVPVLSRLYDPGTYGVFSIYISIIGIVSCIASLRYEMAMMLPKEESDAAGLFWLCGMIIFGFAIVVCIGCLVFGGFLGTLLKTPELIPWLWLVPLSVFLSGVWQLFIFWSARRKQFHRTSISQVVRATTSSGSQAVAGLFGGHVSGLIFGAILGDVCGTTTFAKQVAKSDWPLIRGSLDRIRLKRLAREYSDFPMYTSPSSLLNTFSACVPSLLLAPFFGKDVVGYYSLGFRIVWLPASLIINALKSVLFQKVSEVYNLGGDTYALFKKVTLGLIGIVMLPSLLIMIFAPMLTAFILGDRWYTAGEYARWLVLWLSVMFCNAPAMIFGQVYRRQRALFIIDVALLVCRVSSIVIGGMFLTAMKTVILYSIVGFLFNVFIIVWIWSYVRHKSKFSSTASSFG